ncbi:MAG: InlB B-repeat-containing protein [Eubacterium sp.]|nr:InlB B-repeat-containing protein [Eubacterium sp.]
MKVKKGIGRIISIALTVVLVLQMSAFGGMVHADELATPTEPISEGSEKELEVEINENEDSPEIEEFVEDMVVSSEDVQKENVEEVTASEAVSEGVYNISDGDIIIDADQDGVSVKQGDNTEYVTGTITLTGTSTSDNIIVNNVDAGGTVNLILEDLSIDSDSYALLVNCNNPGAVYIELNGENTLKAGTYHAGLELKGNGLLTIKDDIGRKEGRLTASGGEYGSGIGSGRYRTAGDITISGGNIQAYGGYDGAGIGSGEQGTVGAITINGGEVHANGAGDGAGIGSGYYGTVNEITINGGEVHSTGYYCGAGVGIGDYGTVGDITINGGNIQAYGGYAGAGIGSGYNGTIGDITINGGEVHSTGYDCGAGIGSSFLAMADDIRISDGLVVSKAGDYAEYGIKCGYGDSIVISGSAEVHVIGREYEEPIEDNYDISGLGEEGGLFTYPPDTDINDVALMIRVTFSAGKGTVSPESFKIAKNGQLKKLPEPVLDGYSFTGWYMDEGYETKVDTDTVFTEDTTIYAGWSKNDFTVDAIPSEVYKGTVVHPSITVRDINTKATLSEGKDYTVSYSKNDGTIEETEMIDAGKYDVTIQGQGNYVYAAQNAIFTVTKNMNNTVKASIEDWKEGESASTPVVTADFGEDTATVLYSTSKDGGYSGTVPTKAGTYYMKAVVTDTENYIGSESQPVRFSITPKPQVHDRFVYQNKQGSKTEWTKGSKEYLRFVYDRDEDGQMTREHYTGCKIDDQAVDPAFTVLTTGSIIIDVKPEYLETLSAGEHTFEALFDDGDGDKVRFSIKEAEKTTEKDTETITEATTEANTETTTEKPTENKSEMTTEDRQQTTTQASTEEPKNNTTMRTIYTSVKTGDNANIILVLILAVLSLSGIAVIIRLKKTR